jgi:predicted AAA+ superfamily ATPase
MITRIIGKAIRERIGGGKAIILMGARQTGKTTLVKEIFNDPVETLYLTGDDSDTQALFDRPVAPRLRRIFLGKKYVVLDEAQRVKNIGLKIKLLTDQMPEIQVIATGSSSFDLANEVNEPLTGRKWEYRLYPLSCAEMAAYHGVLEEERLIPHRLVYGYYPEVVTHPGDERDLLRSLSDSYLYKDVLMWDRVKKSRQLVKLLQALAYQVGSQVSYSELAQMCALDTKTVENYIGLLEQCFVIFRLGSFSRNLRNELKASRKIYFYDNGIRNAVVADFSLPETRRDIGALWENFLVSERRKKLDNEGLWRHTWFWRTTEQKEIDYLEEGDGKMRAFEFKWNPRLGLRGKKISRPKQFFEAYPGSDFTIVTPENVGDFLLEEGAGERDGGHE